MTTVVGIGNALVDILITLPDDSLLRRLGLPRGTMNLVDLERSRAVLDATGRLSRTVSSGGSAANTVHGLTRLGVPCSFVGKVSDDEWGHYFLDDLTGCGIVPRLLIDGPETGRAVALITPDGERTFATYLGAAVKLSAADLHAGMFADAAIVHIEGYLVQDHALLEQALSVARQSGARVSLDLASHNVVSENIEFLRSLAARRLIDILFANEEEAQAFTGRPPEEALPMMAATCPTVIVKLGKEGSIVSRNGITTRIAAVSAPCLDTTGAGDLYAAGFLYGLLRDLPSERCGAIGSLLASRVICRVGAKMDDHEWGEIRRAIGI
ncbi:MAG TPA: adenosine kinase [bacterium]|nr:adenosine kinase [bacterium]